MQDDGPKVNVRVWDLPTRLFHWTLVGLVAASLITGKLGPMHLHQASGLAILALILFRLAWGFVGGTHARFADFVKGPRAAFDYLKGRAYYIGHNPLGGLMVLALLALLPLQATLGLFGNDDISYDAPLSKFISKSASDAATGWHGLSFKLILVLVALHVGAAFYYLIARKDNLIRPMISGWKSLPASLAHHQAEMGHPLLAAGLLAVAGLAAGGLLLL
ncbi:MAG: cytochrome b/b6 domain-containing protein [Rhodospirillales bacterium]|jgi:cytochrome b|nr:cytochrome b/b6 domain-containing protein [Rhodospirillales bacterium]